MFKCVLCSEEFENERKLHTHIVRTEKIHLEDYYTSFFERRDLFTGELIKFKSKEYYLSTLFNTRINMIQYLKRFPERAPETIKQVIKARSELKGLTRMLSTVECRSCVYPTPYLLEVLGMDWCDLGKELGLECIYDYKQDLEFDTGDVRIIIDTREQAPLDFVGCKTIVNKLDFGDMTTTSHFKNVFIERKSLGDLCSTLSQGFERLNRELARAREFNAYIIILVEAELQNLISVNRLPAMKYIKASSEFLCHRLRDIMDLNNNCQFVFVKDRIEAAEMAKKIFLLKNPISKIDLQHRYDKGLLKGKK